MECFWLIVQYRFITITNKSWKVKAVSCFKTSWFALFFFGPKSQITTNSIFYSVLRLGHSIATLPPPLRPFTYPKCIFNCSTKFADILPRCERETVQHLKRIIPAWYANGELMIESALLGKIGHQVSPFVYHICKSQ